jgi:enoyl-[acyl-carrier-protein] reductase (NADH)
VTQRTIVESEDYVGTWSKITPLGKPATVENIANAVLFFIADEAKHITGQTLIVDGGWTCISPSPYENNPE